MKKLISILMIFMICVSLAACAQISQVDENGNPIKPNNKNEDVTLENTNFASGGFVTYSDGYSYFVNNPMGAENDVYQIVKIGDEKDAEPEVIYEVQTSGGDGYSYQTINRLMSYDKRIYFFETDNQNIQALKWVSVDGKENGTVITDILNMSQESVSAPDGAEAGQVNASIASYEGRYLYLVNFGRDYTVRYDLKDGSSKVFDNTSSHSQTEKSMFRILGIYKENIYYVKGDVNGNVINGIYYSSIVSYEEKELCAIDIQSNEGLMNLTFANNYIFYPSENSSYGGGDTIVLNSIDLKTGEKKTVCEYSDGYGMDFVINNDTVYYFKGSCIWTCKCDGSDNALLIEDPDSTNEKTWMQVTDKWIYYGDLGRNDPELYRIAMDGKIFPTTKICH